MNAKSRLLTVWVIKKLFISGEQKNQQEVQFLTPNNHSHVHTYGEKHIDLINFISLNSLTDI